MDILPKDLSNFPIFFKPDEKHWLKGSPFLAQVEEKIEDIRTDYDLLCKEIPEYDQFPIEEYSQCRMMVSSRIFGIQVSGVKTDGFVAYADMLNHKRPRQTSWTYSDEHNGFIIEACEDIKRGEQVYDSYGKKCNSRFFMNYGFINLDNDANEVPVRVYYNDEDPHKENKKQMLSDKSSFRKFRVVDNFEDRVMYEFMSWVRFIEFDENMAKMYEFKGAAQQAQRGRRDDSDDSEEEDTNKAFTAKKLPPISI
jgi:histone-lysine N-methyltransferase SETD3